MQQTSGILHIWIIYCVSSSPLHAWHPQTCCLLFTDNNQLNNRNCSQACVRELIFVSHSFDFSYFFSFTNKIHTPNHSFTYFSKSYLCILPLIDSRQRIKQLYLHSAAAHGMAFGACSLWLFIQKVFSGPPSRSLLTPRDGIQSQALIIWCITKRLRNCKAKACGNTRGESILLWACIWVKAGSRGSERLLFIGVTHGAGNP